MRINQVTAIIGDRGTGKSFFTRQIIQEYRNKRTDMKILIVDTHDHPMYRDIPIITVEMLKRWKGNNTYRVIGRPETIIPVIQSYLYNSLLIFEDASKYMEGKLQEDIKYLVLDSKQKNLDIIFQFHGFADIPPKLLRWMDVMEIFKTDDPVVRKQIISMYSKVRATWERVMKHKEKYYHETIIIH